MSAFAEIKPYRPARHSGEMAHFDVEELEALAGNAVTHFEYVEGGLDVRYLQAILAELQLSTNDLSRLLRISPSTLGRRIRRGRQASESLTPMESDRVFTVMRVYKKAVELFEGDRAKARRWMQRPVRGLDDHTPLEMIATETGAHAVEQVIGRLEHGVYT